MFSGNIFVTKNTPIGRKTDQSPAAGVNGSYRSH